MLIKILKYWMNLKLDLINITFFQPWVFVITSQFLYACLVVQVVYDQIVCLYCINWLVYGNWKIIVCILSDWFFVCCFYCNTLIDVFSITLWCDDEFKCRFLCNDCCLRFIYMIVFTMNVWHVHLYFMIVFTINVWHVHLYFQVCKKFSLLMLGLYIMFMYSKHFCG